MIIAIDGPAGAGKSTIARRVAKQRGFIYIDTGAIYRALTLKALQSNIDLHDEAALIRMAEETRISLNNNPDGSIRILLDAKDVSEAIRDPRITRYVSDLARIKGVRQKMLALQRRLAAAGNSVLDGRDIGTVVFPDADKKFYLDARFAERARRRLDELRQLGNPITLPEVEADLKNRDAIDSTRSCAPLKKAADAIYIDTTDMTIEEVVNTILKEI